MEAAGVMTIDEVSVHRKLPQSTLYRLTQERQVPGQKVGKHWRFHKEAVDARLKDADDTARRE